MNALLRWFRNRRRRVWLDVTDLKPGHYYVWFAVMQGGTVVSDDAKPWPPTEAEAP